MSHVNLAAALSLLNVVLNSILVFLTYGLIVQLKEGSDLNIFGGPTGKTSKRVRCDNIAGDIESLRDSDDYLAEAIAEREGQGADVGYPYSTEGKGHIEVSDDTAPTGLESPTTNKEEPESQRVYTGTECPVFPPLQEPIEKTMKEPFWKESSTWGKDTDIIEIYHDEELMRDALQQMLAFISNPAIYENDKWSCINNHYCTLSYGKPREKAEVLRRYFRKLDVIYKRKDGTHYSVLVSPAEAKDIIEELIEVYPWDKPIKQVQKEPEVKPIQKEGLKEAINQLCDVVEKIRQVVDRG
jgi:hypothetical protein